MNTMSRYQQRLMGLIRCGEKGTFDETRKTKLFFAGLAVFLLVFCAICCISGEDQISIPADCDPEDPDYDMACLHRQTIENMRKKLARRASSCRIPTVEPQNFTMREAGLIFNATAQHREDGLIELACKVQFVSDPIWKDFGMRLPFASGGQISASPSEVAYYDLAMEQPIFPVCSVDTRLRIKPGTTLALETGSNTDAKDGRMAVFFPFLFRLPLILQSSV